MKRLILVIVGAGLIASLSTSANADRFNRGREVHTVPHTIGMRSHYEAHPMYRQEYREYRPQVRAYPRFGYGYRARVYGRGIGRGVGSQAYVHQRGRYYESYSAAGVAHGRHVLASHGCSCNCCCGNVAVAAPVDPPEDSSFVGPVTISPTANIPSNWQIIR